MNEKVNLKFAEDTIAGALDAAHVAKTEKMIGLKLPSDYLDFLKANNGGVPDKRLFRLDDDIKALEAFLCIDVDYRDSEFGDLDIGVVWTRIEDRLDENLVPFAAVYAGDFLCFDYEEDAQNPKVVLWYAELSDEEGPYLIPVADSFRDFLPMLTDEKPN